MTGNVSSRRSIFGVIALVTVSLFGLTACEQSGGEVLIDADDIGGVVTGPNGPEAGVWVIAETTDLPTTFNKIVVTDDQGRYLLPDLPSATYDVWVRGYGLVDSPKRTVTPGTTHDVTAVVAPDPHAAAQYYPAGYWLSLISVPDADQFPGTGPDGNGISPAMESQAHWIRYLKSGGCAACHQLGTKATREIPGELGDFASTEAAWERRIQSGQAGGSMISGLSRMGLQAGLKMFADWTDRIVAGEVPPAPPRPSGVERNVVISQWDWADPKAYLHDEVSTDRRDPTVNANGRIYGALEASADYLPVLDPVSHARSEVPVPVRDPNTPVASGPPMMPSPYWGDEAIWDSRANVHNPMLDHRARVWITSRVRSAENPAFCREGSDHPSAQRFPTTRTGRHLAMFDPATEGVQAHQHMLQHTPSDVCGRRQQHAVDERWWSGHRLAEHQDVRRDRRRRGVTGLVSAHPRYQWQRRAGRVGRAERADRPRQGQAHHIGLLRRIVQPRRRLDLGHFARIPWRRRPVRSGNESHRILPAAMGRLFGRSRTGLLRREVETSIANGVFWSALASGHMASFDRSKCTGPLNGPSATGQHCPEGWTLYPEPIPQLKGLTDSGSAEASYYTWVDQFNTLGLGEGVPINTGNGSEGLLALQDEEWVVLRVPYPLGFFTKWMDGRIDDPDARLERKGPMGDLQHTDTIPSRDREGHYEQSRALSTEARPARAVRGGTIIQRGTTMIRRRHVVIGTVGLTLISVLGLASACMDERAEQALVTDGDVPLFEVDPLWPKPLPNHWILGSTIGVSRGLPGPHLDHPPSDHVQRRQRARRDTRSAYDRVLRSRAEHPGVRSGREPRGLVGRAG